MGIKEIKKGYKSEIKEYILKAALKLFHEEGFSRVTMRQIAKEVGYSPATIYTYFQNKADLFHNLYEEGFKKFYQLQISTMSIEDPFERLKQHGRIYIQFALQNQEFYDVMFIMHVTGFVVKDKIGSNGLEMGKKSYEYFQQNVRDCINAGYFVGEYSDIICFLIWSCVHGIASLVIRGRTALLQPEDLEYVINGSLESLFSLLDKKKI